MKMKRLKPLRQLNGMSREELAAKLEVSFSTIANYEQGVREPNFKTLRKLSEIFNVTVDYLIENEYAATKNDLLVQVERMVEAEHDMKAIINDSKNIKND